MISEEEIVELQGRINNHSTAIIDHYHAIIGLEQELAIKKNQFELERKIRERPQKCKEIFGNKFDLKNGKE